VGHRSGKRRDARTLGERAQPKEEERRYPPVVLRLRSAAGVEMWKKRKRDRRCRDGKEEEVRPPATSPRTAEKGAARAAVRKRGASLLPRTRPAADLETEKGRPLTGRGGSVGG
jgi:hypothetical protein